MVWCWLLGLVLVLVAPTIGENDGFMLKLLDAATGGLCLDGSPGGFYYRPSTANSSDWLIHFEGGGWCVNEQDCLGRSRTDIGSSAKWPEEGVPSMDGRAHGFLSSDPIVNPAFHDWNMVHINYCDGASYAGYKLHPIQVQGQDLYFRGAVILDEVFKALLGLGLESASNLIVGGTSAGGLAVYIHIDYIRSLVPKSVRVVGFPDSAMFINITSFAGQPSYSPLYEYVFKMQNLSSWTLDQDCLIAHATEPVKCFFAEHVLPHISTPMFIAQSMVDSWSLSNILELPCFVKNSNLANCSAAELKAVQQFSSEMVDLVGPAFDEHSSHGIWMDSCLTHGGQDNDVMFSHVRVHGQTMQETLRSWLQADQEKKWKVLDNIWPNGCLS